MGFSSASLASPGCLGSQFVGEVRISQRRGHDDGEQASRLGEAQAKVISHIVGLASWVASRRCSSSAGNTMRREKEIKNAIKKRQDYRAVDRHVKSLGRDERSGLATRNPSPPCPLWRPGRRRTRQDVMGKGCCCAVWCGRGTDGFVPCPYRSSDSVCVYVLSNPFSLSARCKSTPESVGMYITYTHRLYREKLVECGWHGSSAWELVPRRWERQARGVASGKGW